MESIFAPVITSFSIALKILGWVLSYAYVWAPPLLMRFAWRKWIEFRQSEFIAKKEKVLLQIKLPKQFNKSPLAMELVLGAFYQVSGETTWIDRTIKGQVRAWFSLEIVSVGGNISFYVWTWKELRRLIEAYLYSQYPSIEITEASDYSAEFSYDQEKYDTWGCEMQLTKPDPYPIRTYIDYGLDKNPDEDQKVDPLTTVLEFLGSLQEGQSVWYQIMIRAHKKRPRPGTWNQTMSWQDEASELVDKLMKRDSKTKKPVQKDEKDLNMAMLSDDERETIKAIERSVGKPGFECGFRCIYIDKKGGLQGAIISGMLGSIVHSFNSPSLNGFKPTRGLMPFAWPWSDPWGMRSKRVMGDLFALHKRRAYFYPPAGLPEFILNTEELATVYHLPGEVVQTATVDRVASTKAEPPQNLPM